MTRYSLIGTLGCLVLASAALGCGDDDDDPRDGGTSPAPGKTLRSLTAAEVEALCEDLLGTVSEATTPARQCVELALSSAETESACDSARLECIQDKLYQDFGSVRCPQFTASTRPRFECDTKIPDVKTCYDRVATWIKGLRCSQAGDAPKIPSCVAELDKDCGFTLTALLGASTAELECRADGEAYAYDFGGSPQCNSCAVQHCCDSYVACRGDTACACYWDCLGEGESDCFALCHITTHPDTYADHASCLIDNCESPCDLQSAR